MSGWSKDYPPSDEAGFLDYVRSLPHPALYELIKDAVLDKNASKEDL